jgi:hypothetical protein
MGRAKKVKEPKKKVLSDVQFIKIEMALEMYKCLLPLYIKYKNDEKKFKIFCGLNRNLIFDITKGDFFKVGLISEEALKKLEKTTQEHLYNRTLSSKIIFPKFEENPNMTVDEFIKILLKYGVTITMTCKEHNDLPKSMKGFYEKTHEDYENNGVYIPGLKEYIEYSKSIKL